jgi:hypothetical protein
MGRESFVQLWLIVSTCDFAVSHEARPAAQPFG